MYHPGIVSSCPASGTIGCERIMMPFGVIIFLVSWVGGMSVLCAPLNEFSASLHMLPPGVSLAPIAERLNSFANLSDGNKKHPSLQNTLLQAIVEESEQKKRVQRYRDIEK